MSKRPIQVWLEEQDRRLLEGRGPVRAAEVLTTLKRDPLIQEVYVDAELQRAALGDWIRRFADQSFSFTDAVSFALMRRDRIDAAFTFDRRFAVAGFTLLPAEREPT